MSDRSRGIEQQIMLGVDGQLQDGSWTKVQNWNVEARGEITEDDYLGEDETDLDIRHDGWTVTFDIHEKDAKAIDVMDDIVKREKQHTRHPRIVLNQLKTFRDPAQPPITLMYRKGVMRITGESASSRQDRVVYSVEAKFKHREKISG